jgi:hypothetical protein
MKYFHFCVEKYQIFKAMSTSDHDIFCINVIFDKNISLEDLFLENDTKREMGSQHRNEEH